MAKTNTDSEAPITREEAISRSYPEATKNLREKYLPEFNADRQQIIKRLGFEWTPPPTDEEKAAKTIEELIAANPGLAAMYQKVDPPQETPAEEPESGAEG